jgi:hypothetical protein
MTAKFGFDIKVLTPEEELLNEAHNVVYGYQRVGLGKNQRKKLEQMRHGGFARWGKSYQQGLILLSLEKRKLVEAGEPDRAPTRRLWRLTPLGRKVAEMLAGEQ